MSQQSKAASGKTKPGRVRAACSACRTVKQKCDGVPPAICSRCTIYSLACSYDGVPYTTRAIDLMRSADNPAKDTRQLDQSPSPPSTSAVDPTDMASTLREIKDRLRWIEDGIKAERRRAVQKRGARLNLPEEAPVTSKELDNEGPQHIAARTDSDAQNASSELNMPAESNPLQILEQTMAQLDAFSIGDNVSEWDSPAAASEQIGTSSMTATPMNALARGAVTIDECEHAFKFFHAHFQPWIGVLGDPEDQIPALVLTRSPLLFHAVLLVTFLHTGSQSKPERSDEIYRELLDIVNLLFAWQFFAPEGRYTNSDLVRAIAILMLYKPVQYTALLERGMTDRSKITHLSKVNVLSSMMLQGMVHRTADLVGVSNAPSVFLRAVEKASPNEPIPAKVLADLRLHFFLIFTDIHGSLHSGRSTASDSTNALRTTRLFANIRAQVTDPRRAAIVELYAIARAPQGVNAVEYRLRDLDRINQRLEAWSAEWAPMMKDALRAGDTLAYTVHSTLLQIVIYMTNAPVFTRWTIEKQRLIELGDMRRPKLTDSDWQNIQLAANAAQFLVFSVSRQSRTKDQPLRQVRWPDPQGGAYMALELDSQTVQDYRAALDTVNCVGFISALILLVRMSTSGLLSNDLVCCRAEYESDAGPPSSPLLKAGRKLIRLLELGKEFLHTVSPNDVHPTKKHALLVETMIKAGRGDDASHSGPTQVPSASIGMQTTTFPSNSTMLAHSPVPNSAYLSAGQGQSAIEGLSLSPQDQFFQYYAGPDPILGLSNDLGSSDALIGMMEWNSAMGPL